jgi:hypothetical protein
MLEHGRIDGHSHKEIIKKHFFNAYWANIILRITYLDTFVAYLKN